jgi:hypothetical protein
MYMILVGALMIVLPIASILLEWIVTAPPDLVALAGKWFVFWIAGVRLLAAGIKQMRDPAFTAREIFEIEAPDAMKIVSELGVANVAIGTVGVLSIVFSTWVIPAAVYATIFYGLAAIRHFGNAGMNAKERFATWTDLWAAVVLGVFVAATAIRAL